MIKILNCRKKNYHFELNKLLNKRMSGIKINSNVVKNIISDVRKNGDKALIKYEMRYAKNNEIIFKKKKITKNITSLDLKIKKAISTCCLILSIPHPTILLNFVKLF